uniref:Si:dkey-103g5.3 n=1 Tax=Cyclopterus lumpus TaxID=8103 RepID=A0A8C3A364_CYCLU
PDSMTLYLCLSLLVVLLQPALCLYNCSSEYERIPDNSDLTVVCGASTITVEINLCTAQWAGFNTTDLALNGNHNTTECHGSIDTSVNPPIILYQLPVNHSQDNPCRQSLQVRRCPFSSFSSIQSVIITGFIDTPRSDQGLISYSTDLYYHFSCRYPLEYLINNTQIVAAVSSGLFYSDFLFLQDSDYGHPLVLPSTGLELLISMWMFIVKKILILKHRVFLFCSIDQRTSVTSNGLSKVAWFNFEAFRFVRDRNQAMSSIYLHCILRLCEPSTCQEILSVS